MPVEVSCRLIFLASPGGLDEERARCRDIVRTHNETYTLENQTSFFLHAWEDVPGGVGRPQDLINPSLDDCDFTVILFGEWWGSPPAKDGKYTSGTEEEFFRALELLAQADRPMRDILVAFKTVAPERVRDAGPSLRSVLRFRARLEASKSLMYENFDSLDSLERLLRRKLREWSKPLNDKEPRYVSIPDAELDTEGGSARDRAELLAVARRNARSGLLMQAETAFAIATEDGDPQALLEFAQFMRRTGRLEQALGLNNRLLMSRGILTSDSDQALGARVSAMANIGLIERKRGQLSKSLAALREAVETADSARRPLGREHTYALDNYGLSLLRAGNAQLALEQFKRADALRAASGDALEQAQSAVNLGRQHMSLLKLAEALGHFRRALDLLKAEADDHLAANANAGLAEALIRLDRDAEAEEPLRIALDLNTRLQNTDGLSIVHCLLARLLLRRGDHAEGARHIVEAAELTSASGNAQGECVVAWLSAESARVRGAAGQARSLLKVAEKACRGILPPSLQSDLEATRAALQVD